MSFHVIKLWNGLPVVLFHVIKVDRCVDTPRDLMWHADKFASKIYEMETNNANCVKLTGYGLFYCAYN